jgi:hypothetical protein
MKKIVMIVFAGLLISAGLQAQELYIENGKVILDLTAGTGMPAGAVTADSKTALYAGATPVNNDTIINNTHIAAINAKVFQKLEIAPANNSGGTANWVTAFNVCKNLTYNGNDDWRLPTQREFQLIWIFNNALNAVLPSIGYVFSAAYYWCATEVNTSEAWYINFNNGDVLNASKSGLYYTRCVREVTTP